MRTWLTKNNIKIICLLSGRSNVFLISKDDMNILVDTSPARLWIRLKRRLKKLGIHTIDFLILTHCHFDHAANASKIKSDFRAKVIINEKEASILRRGENAVVRGTSGLLDHIVSHIAPALMPVVNFEPCEPDISVAISHDPVPIDRGIKILHTPGHTPGSQSIIVDDEIALVGDAMFGIFKNSVFPPFGENAGDIIRSWGRLLETNCRIFMPSHGNENSRRLVEADYNRRQQTSGL